MTQLDLPFLRRLQEVRVDFEFPNMDGETPAYLAAFSGNVPVLEFFFKVKVNVRSPTSHGLTPAHGAALNDSVNALEFLRHVNVDLEMPSVNEGMTPVCVAANAGNLNSVKMLYLAKVDMHCRDSQGRTLVYTAALNGHVGVLQFLRRAKVCLAIYEATNHAGESPAFAAASKGHASVLRFFQRIDVKLFTPRNDGTTPLQIASQAGHLSIVRILLAASREHLEVRDQQGRTPAHVPMMVETRCISQRRSVI